jgi:hypothetical protein
MKALVPRRFRHSTYELPVSGVAIRVPGYVAVREGAPPGIAGVPGDIVPSADAADPATKRLLTTKTRTIATIVRCITMHLRAK